MSKSKDSIGGTLTVAIGLCLACSVVVSSAAVLLKPTQVANATLNMKENILRAGGMVGDAPTKAEVEEIFGLVEQRIIDLETGEIVGPEAAGFNSLDAFNQLKVAQNPETSQALTSAEDIAGIKRRERYAKVYLVMDESEIETIILPVRGYGLWSTLHGFMALEGDANTVKGFGFYQHAETPGLGGEVDNPSWKGQWPGKKIYDDNGEVATRLVKGGVNPDSEIAQYGVDGLAGATLTARGVENLVHYWLGQEGFKTFLAKLKSGELSNV